MMGMGMGMDMGIVRVEVEVEVMGVVLRGNLALGLCRGVGWEVEWG
jgi:hypothetical protein